MIIHTIPSTQPHSSHGGWLSFLEKSEHRRHEYGVILYGRTNCNYILFPDGLLVLNYGFHGRAMMDEIARLGPDIVLEKQ